MLGLCSRSRTIPVVTEVLEVCFAMKRELEGARETSPRTNLSSL